LSEDFPSSDVQTLPKQDYQPLREESQVIAAVGIGPLLMPDNPYHVGAEPRSQEILTMHPPHDTAYPINYLLRQRWSPRAFANRRVEPEKLRSVLEAARWAPSSSNGQPWNFIVATKDDPAEFDRMLGCLVEGNQVWARSAPVLMVSVASSVFAHNGKPNRHAFYDTGAAAAMLSVEATSLGLHVHQMAGFLPDKVREVYGVPATAEPASAIALGYLGDPSALSEELRKRELTPGQRKPMSEFVFSSGWGKRPEWLK
jgi:nitroreductase